MALLNFNLPSLNTSSSSSSSSGETLNPNQIEFLRTPFISSTTTLTPSLRKTKSSSSSKKRYNRNPRNTSTTTTITCAIRPITPDPWTLTAGGIKYHYKKPPKPRLCDDDARRIINGKARYLSRLRKNQGSLVQTPRWIKRSPEQMVQFLKDDRHGQLYGKHVLSAIKIVRNLATRAEGSYDMRDVMGYFVSKLTFRDMCVVLKEQKGWRPTRDFFDWMKLQLIYEPSVVAYTIVLRTYGQAGKLKLAEQTFLEMLEAGCEADEVACGTMLCTYARWGRHTAMLSFYSAVQERGVIPPVTVFNFMISSLQKKSLHKEVIQLWRQMLDARVSPTDFTYTIVISSYTKEDLLEEAFETFNKMKKSAFVPAELTYSQLINLSSKHGNQYEALKLYQEMRSHGIVPSNYTCASLLTLYYKSEDYPKALSLFSEMENSNIPADEVIYGLLIRIYGKLGLYDDAKKTFEEIGQLGLLNDEKTYVSMAQVHISMGNFEEALSTLMLMRSRDICFSRYAHSVLLQCYAVTEDVRSAEVTFQDLFKTGPPNAFSCKDMLNLYMRLGLLEKAKAFTAQLRRDGVQFDEDLYKVVMKVYCKHGMLRDAEQLIEEMGKSAHVKHSKFMQTSLMASCSEPWRLKKSVNTFEALDQPDTMALEWLLSLYFSDGENTKTRQLLNRLLQTTGGVTVANQLIHKSIWEGDTSKAEFLFDQIINLGYRPDDAATASMIRLYSKLQKLKRVQEVFGVVAETSASIDLICSFMIEAFAKCGEAEEVYWLYKEIIKKGDDQIAVMISMIVNALTTYGKHEVAENIIRTSFHEEVKLDTVAYNTYIKAMLEAGRLHFATSLYYRMVSSGLAPSIQTYNTMISVYGRGQKLDKAIEMFNTAKSLSITLDEKAYTNMISYYGKAGKCKEASLLFAKMLEEGIKPGNVSYKTMMHIYATEGLADEAEKLFQTMLSNGVSPDSFNYLPLIQAYTKNQKYLKAEEAIMSMQKEGLYPSCAHYNHLLYGLTQAGLIGDAERVYTELKEAGLSPDLTCNRIMLRGYLEYGHVQEGISFFEQTNKSTKPDAFFLSAAVHLYKSAGQALKAVEVLDFMNKLRISFLENLEVGSKNKISLGSPSITRSEEEP